jgi:hypothetical protein
MRNNKQITSGGEEDLSPSSPLRRPKWLLHTLRDVGEAPRSAVRENRPPRKFLKLYGTYE